MFFPAIKHFIFDLDGTLADTMGDLRSAMNLMLGSFGFRPVTKEEALFNINRGARAFVRGCLPVEVREDENFVENAYAVYSRF